MNAAQEYLAARVLTARPESLHLLVVDGALRQAARAEAALEAGDRRAAQAALEEARKFVAELIGGLDNTAAPEVVANMAAIFTFAYRRLVEAGLYGSAGKVRDAIKVLRMHRETWSELLAQVAGTAREVGRGDPAAVAIPPERRVAPGYEEYQPRSWCG